MAFVFDLRLSCFAFSPRPEAQFTSLGFGRKQGPPAAGRLGRATIHLTNANGRFPVTVTCGLKVRPGVSNTAETPVTIVILQVDRNGRHVRIALGRRGRAVDLAALELLLQLSVGDCLEPDAKWTGFADGPVYPGAFPRTKPFAPCAAPAAGGDRFANTGFFSKWKAIEQVRS